MTLGPGIFQQIDCGCLPRKEQDLHVGYWALIRIASSTPEMPGMTTSDMSRSGAFDRAAVNSYQFVPLVMILFSFLLYWFAWSLNRLTKRPKIAEQRRPKAKGPIDSQS
jgi:hypothetical protein